MSEDRVVTAAVAGAMYRKNIDGYPRTETDTVSTVRDKKG